jgi:predicted Zn-dependent protease with MMP-like domain
VTAPTENDWTGRSAPSLADFEELAEEAFARLPESFRKLSGAVPIIIEDFAEPDVLEGLGIESEFDLLGLFHGVGLAQGAATPQTGQMPNRVFLYRRPILEYWLENEDTLDAIVAHVLIHEIGHHFGLSDADMDAIEAEADGD